MVTADEKLCIAFLSFLTEQKNIYIMREKNKKKIEKNRKCLLST